VVIDGAADGSGDDWPEDAWVDRGVEIGAVRVHIRKRCTRCAMTVRAQPGIERDTDIFRTLAAHHASAIGVLARVTVPGRIAVGDPVSVAAEPDR
jgi:uncharacterized protein YcbX